MIIKGVTYTVETVTNLILEECTVTLTEDVEIKGDPSSDSTATATLTATATEKNCRKARRKAKRKLRQLS